MLKNIRNDFPLLSSTNRAKPLVYLDSAATTQKPRQVIDAVSSFYESNNANVHRGIYQLSEQATKSYENVRKSVADFIGTADPRSIIFTSGTTESINLVAYAWGRKNLKPRDEILITEMEHHSNIVPWQLTTRETGANLRYIPILKNGTLDLSDPEKYFTKKTKLVSIIHQSNVFGTINPVKQIIDYAKSVGAITIVDAAQSVPHANINVEELGCDFLAFSGHKMLAPTGIGVLYGKTKILEEMIPFLGGGEMISSVSMESATWNEIPYKFEAGTPKIAQVIGLGAAIEYLNKIGMDDVQKHGQDLLKYALISLSNIPELTIYGDSTNRGAVISFNVDNVHPHDLAQFLDQDGIAVRAGHHCAQPIMTKLGLSSTTRASFYLYNTKKEIDALCESIVKTKNIFSI
ncbi:MAG: cysteine desulfurase [Candidatus Marinimicrobia bacterium]|nr:cysteine desulfurase [Candidatus Neomarinimicrobiota bacterium]